MIYALPHHCRTQRSGVGAPQVFGDSAGDVARVGTWVPSLRQIAFDHAGSAGSTGTDSKSEASSDFNATHDSDDSGPDGFAEEEISSIEPAGRQVGYTPSIRPGGAESAGRAERRFAGEERQAEGRMGSGRQMSQQQQQQPSDVLSGSEQDCSSGSESSGPSPRVGGGTPFATHNEWKRATQAYAAQAPAATAPAPRPRQPTVQPAVRKRAAAPRQAPRSPPQLPLSVRKAGSAAAERLSLSPAAWTQRCVSIARSQRRSCPLLLVCAAT